MVSNERSIFRNTAVSAAGRGAGDLGTFLFLIFFARSFGSDALGDFWFAMAIGALLATLVVHGVNTLLVREIARRPAEGPRLVGAVGGSQLVIATLLWAALFMFASVLTDGERARNILLIMSAYQLLYTLALVFRQYFAAREQMQYGALLEAGHKGLILFGGLLAMTVIARAEVVLLIYPLAAAAMYVAGFAMIRARDAAPVLHIDASLSYRWFMEALPLFAATVLLVVQERAGIIFLGSTYDAASVGLYAAGDRLVAAASLVFLMFNNAMFPVMARLESPSELNKLLVRCMRIALTLAFLLATGLVLLREPIIELLFGSEFQEAAGVLAVLALGMVITAVAGPANMLMIARHQLKAVLWIRLFGVTIFFAAMAVLVPSQGFIGLAWSVLLLKICSCIAALTYLGRQGSVVPLWHLLRAPFAAGAGMVIVFILSQSLPFVLHALLTALVGSLLLVAFKGIARQDLHYLRRILRPAT